MTRLLALALCLTPVALPADIFDELDAFGAMVETADGAPVGTATLIAGIPERGYFVTGRDVATASAPCVRVWYEGSCFEITEIRPLPGVETLSIVTAMPSQSENDARYRMSDASRGLLVSTYDPDTGDALSFMTQTALGGWERPLTPVAPSGAAAGRLVLRSPAITALSVGAPVMHPRDGLVGVLAQTVDGAGALIPIAEVQAAAEIAGLTIWDGMRAAAPDEGGLPRRIAMQTGGSMFNDYSSIGFLQGYYHPGAGYAEGFTTEIGFSVWEVDPAGGGATYLTGEKKVALLSGSGLVLAAPFDGTPADHLAICVYHATPSSEGRQAFTIQFERSHPARFDDTDGTKYFDTVADHLKGWVTGDGIASCEAALRNLDAGRMAALTGVAPTGALAATTAPVDAPGTSGAVQPAEEVYGVQGPWRRVAIWQATGLEALFRDLPGGRLLTVGCTRSRELVVDIRPGDAVTAIGGRAPMVSEAGSGFVFLDATVPPSVELIIDAVPLTVEITRDVGPCR
jgi:hypothetical protein